MFEAGEWEDRAYLVSEFLDGGTLKAWAGAERRTWRQVTRAHVGMWLAHLGVAAFILGVTTVRSYETESDVRMRDGESTQVGGYVFRFTGARPVQGPNYAAMQARVKAYLEDHPEYRDAATLLVDALDAEARQAS